MLMLNHAHTMLSQLDMVDLWSDHAPWPHNTVPQSYSFLVKYPFLWWLSYTLTQPRFVHKPLSVLTGWQVGHRIAMVGLALHTYMTAA